MLRIFKRKKREPSMMGQVWVKWAGAVNVVLHRWSDKLTVWTSRYSVRTLKTSLILICMIGSAVFLRIAINAFSKPSGMQKIDHISVPGHVMLQDSIRRIPAQRPMPQQINGIRRFNAYMDSLQNSTAGKKIYDSIVRVRPGLLDSARRIEQLSADGLPE